MKSPLLPQLTREIILAIIDPLKTSLGAIITVLLPVANNAVLTRSCFPLKTKQSTGERSIGRPT